MGREDLTLHKSLERETSSVWLVTSATSEMRMILEQASFLYNTDQTLINLFYNIFSK